MGISSAPARRNGLRPFFALALASVSALAISAPAQAQTQEAPAAGREAQRAYSIPAQPLALALVQFSEQSDLQILYAEDAVEGLISRPVYGRYTAQAALMRLLPPDAPHIEITDNQRLRVGSQNPQHARRESAAADNELVVTGTRIRGAAPAGAHLTVLDRDLIEQSGRASLQDLIQTLPFNFSGSQNEGTQEGTLNARSNFSFASSVDLRGIGADATLTLVNGRRLAPVGAGNFVDISMIPLSAVSRVEVLADGASATYGADAVGGVVNIILNQRFSGAESAVRYGGATQGGAEDIGISHLAGLAWASGRISVAYDYRRRGDVDILERDFTATADFRRWGGSNFERVNANPGNITRIGATVTNLAIPRGQDGAALREADLISGQPNYTNINVDSWLMPRQESHALFLSFAQNINRQLELFADVIASERSAYSERENLGANLVVPESNAYRQLNDLFLGQGNLTIAYHMGADLGPVTTTTETFGLSSMLGAGFTFENNWRLETTLGLARSREAIELANFFDSPTIAGPLASSDLATAFNPFADGSNTNPAVLAGLTFDQQARSRGEVLTYALKADGPLFSIWGGQARAAIGLERRDEEFVYNRVEIRDSGVRISPTAAPGARTVDAIFAELSLPLLSADNRIPLVRSLNMSLSARAEEASDYGSATTPKVGVHWELLSGLSLNGSWGRSFKGPLFQQMLGGTGLSYLTATAAQDPLADNGSTGVLSISGSNPNLKPERAETWTAGITFAPRQAPGLRLSATYFDIDFADRVASPASPFVILANPIGYESVVFRNPSPALITSYLALGTPTGTLPVDGVEVIMDRRTINLSSQRVRGVDIGGVHAVDLPIGLLTLDAALSILLQHELTIAPGASPIVALNTLNGPIDLRGRLSVNWRHGMWAAGLAVNYADDYTDNVSIPSRSIAEFVTYDARIALDLRRAESEKGPQIALNVINLFDEDPPFVNNSTGFAYDASNASPLGRVVTVELRQRW